MRIKQSEPLPDSYDQSEPLENDEPVRFVWEKTIKKSSHNTSMKTRVLKSLVAQRKRYKHVPDKEFEKKVLDTAFEQAYQTMRQKYKIQKDEMSTQKHRRSEEQKYLRARRKERKKTVRHVEIHLVRAIRLADTHFSYAEINKSD